MTKENKHGSNHHLTYMNIKQFLFGEGWFISLRFLAILGAFLGLSSTTFSKDRFEKTIAFLILFFVVYNFFFLSLAFFRRKKIQLCLTLSFITDLLLIFLLVLLTGSIFSPYAFLFYLIIPLSTYYFHFKTGLVITAAYAGVHVMFCLFHPQPWGSFLAMNGQIFSVFLLGLAVGILAEKDRKDKKDIEKLNKDLQVKTVELESAYGDLKNIQQYLANIIESIHCGIITVSQGGEITTWNRAMEEMYKVPRQEALGKKLSEMLPETFMGKVLEEVRKVIKGELTKGHTSEIRYEPTKNQEFLADIDAHQLRDVEGNPLGAVLVVEDVTERVNLEKRLAQSEKLSAIGKLASGLAHEIGTPLSVIRGYAERLLAKLETNDPRWADAEKIKNQLDRITKLVRQLLIFARHSPPQLKQVKVNGIIRSALDMLESELSKAGVQAVLALEESLPVIEADPDKLYQVFFNIIINAKQAMQDRGGTLTLSSSICTRRQGMEENGADFTGFIEMGFSDTGCGIQPNHLKRIFEPFFTTKDVGDGSGLGLAICHGIVCDHGGWIEVGSQPDQGSSFKIILPINHNGNRSNESKQRCCLGEDTDRR